MEGAVRLVIIEPVRHIIALHAVQPHFGQEVRGREEILLKLFPDRLLAALLAELERKNQLRSIFSLNPLIQDQIAVTIGTLCRRCMLFYRNLASAVRADSHFRRCTVVEFFTLFTFAERAVHGMLLRAVYHVASTIFTFEIHTYIPLL